MPKYQRRAVEAVQYAKPTIDPIAYARTNEEEFLRSGQRAAAFDGDKSIRALRAFVKGAKGANGKAVGVGRTAGWGREKDDFRIAVDTANGTEIMVPGDWLIKEGKTVRVIRGDRFEADFGAVK